MSMNVETNSNAPLAQHACDVRRETKAAVTRVKKYATEDINVELHSESLPNLQATGNRREQGQHLPLNLGLFWHSARCGLTVRIGESLPCKDRVTRQNPFHALRVRLYRKRVKIDPGESITQPKNQHQRRHHARQSSSFGIQSGRLVIERLQP